MNVDMRLTAIIQARLGSTRLPRKVLLPIAGRPLLRHVVDRVCCLPVEDVVLATTIDPIDDPLEELGHQWGISVSRGSPADVLRRYLNAADHVKADHIVRITGDCPLLHVPTSSEIIRLYRTGLWDYVSNVDPPTFPDGYDTEAFSVRALRVADKMAVRPYDREHVTPFIRRNRAIFRTMNLRNMRGDMSRVMLSVNTEADLQRVRELIEA